MLSRAALRPLKASTSRLAPAAQLLAPRRSLATEASQHPAGPKKSPRPSGHVSVEELHSRTAADILKERDSGSHAGEMRHFTVNFGALRLAIWQSLDCRQPCEAGHSRSSGQL